MPTKKSQNCSGHLSKPGSPAAMEWVNGLPDFLRAIVLEDWRARGIDLPAEFVHKSGQILVRKTDDSKMVVQSLDTDFSDIGGVRLAA